MTKLTRAEEAALKHFVNTPAETASGYTQFAREIHEHPGVKFGCVLDQYVIPLRPGRVAGFLARPGHGKTSVGGALVYKEGVRLLEQGLGDRYYTAHVSWEQPVEEIEAMFQAPSDYSVTDVAWGRVPLDRVIGDSVKRPKLPVWIFGDSLYKTDLDTPPMTVGNVYHSIMAIKKEYNLSPSLLFFDYIQDIPVPDERDRYMQVSSAMRMVKRLAIQIKCPIIIGIQANQRTDDRKTPIPTMRDTEWSAVIGQKLDVLLALWRPIRTVLPHEEPTIEVGGIHYTNDENLLVVKLLKQRFEQGHGIWGVHFNPATLKIRDYKIEKPPDDIVL